MKRIAIVGSGYMGGGMAQVFALAGYPCSLADVDEDTARTGRRRLVAEADRFESAGLFPAGASDRVAANILAAASIEEAVTEADYIAEVVPEDLNVKGVTLKRIGRAAPSRAIIATNTSAISISTLAAFVVNPERFLGVHWMNPAPFVPSVEIIPSAQTSREVVDVVEAMLDGVGKVPTRASDSAGFVANRLQFALFREAALIVEEGLSTTQSVDEIVSNSFGFRLPFFGPFAIADMAGLDVYAGAFATLEATLGDRFSTPESLHSLVQAGNLGVKSGAGYANYEAGSAAELVAGRDRAYVALESLRRDLRSSAMGVDLAPGG